MMAFISVLFSFIPEDWTRDDRSARSYLLLGAFLLAVALTDLLFTVSLRLLLPFFPRSVLGGFVDLQESTVFLYFAVILLQTVAIIEQHKWAVGGDSYDLYLAVLFLLLSFAKAFLEPFTRVMNGVLVTASFCFLFRSLHVLASFLRDHFHRPHLTGD